ncbi:MULTISPECIES: hypothetical protein [unclassified Streptomyces]|uniref:hypothetical protein n=1 Tax=unclassified Streptomyces TaxID=2593676 RepID=UPI0006C1AF3B|nr:MULTISPECIES: hypothetical protein [unclassified Streptomyces]KOX25836.1 hypothetical protein ADL06_17565 [Streptomyces sp. NRRL F-6491]KOX41546.1 hypothetical protein ADL08_18450 [Streptomyces sp. NRRL F-6492]
MDVGSVLGSIGRAAAGAGRLVWAVVTAPTTGTEYDVRSKIDSLVEKIENEVPEELRDRAWGLVLDGLYGVPQEIDQLVEGRQTPDDEEAGGTSAKN